LVFGGAIVAQIISSRVQRGFSLLEVLVAIVVFSIGVLGLALLQLKGAQFTKESGSRTAAISQARSLAEAMRANPAGAKPTSGASDYLYDGTTAYTAADCAATDVSSPDLIAKRDLACWVTSLKRVLPAPAAGTKMATVVADDTLGTLTVTVSWRGVDDIANQNDNQSYSFSYLP
jgi:type IV pilus assembly protein PilV